jgi:BirA family transcriptional regulator, biotin operon repressor / biotin---[acetyl-CoA-carboxylase] ligase
MNRIGSTIIRLDEIGSTNEYAIDLMEKGPVAEGTVIVARSQIAGKGQEGNRWESEPGKNLTATVVFNPRFLSPSEQFRMNKAVSLGVLECCRGFLPGHSLALKWPNDIYTGARKLGGILIQHRVQGATLAVTIAGIGLNINQQHFPQDIPNPVSMFHLLGSETGPDQVLERLCSCLDKEYQGLKAVDPDALDRRYVRSLLGFAEWRIWETSRGTFDGMIAGVDEFGRLQIRDKEGEIRTFAHNEIHYTL